jgi:hypothetical protein
MHPLAFAEAPVPAATPNTSNTTTTFIMKISFEPAVSLLVSQENRGGLVPWPPPEKTRQWGRASAAPSGARVQTRQSVLPP